MLHGPIETPEPDEQSQQQAAVAPVDRHVSVHKDDILHLHGSAYLVIGSVSLGMPIREVTFHLEPFDGTRPA